MIDLLNEDSFLLTEPFGNYKFYLMRIWLLVSPNFVDRGIPLFEKEGLPACAKPLRRRQGGDFLKKWSGQLWIP